MKKTQPQKKVTVAVINYNGESFLEDTFRSVFQLTYPRIEAVYLVDNCSQDNSVSLVRQKYPHVKILQMPQNLGACSARNAIIRKATSDLVFLLDKDVVFGPEVLTQLEDVFFACPETGIASAQICFFDPPNRIQYNGAYIHFAGGAIQNQNTSDARVRVGAVTAIGMLVDRAKSIEIGLFDDDFFYGWEDGDFSFRSTLAGYPVWVVPKAKVFHKKGKRGLFWVNYQVRNRLWFIWKTYSFRTLIVTFLPCLLYQMAIMGFLTFKGQFKGYWKGFFEAFAKLPAILKKRKQFMKIKKVRDRDVLSGDSIDLIGDIEIKGIKKLFMNFLDRFFKTYWTAARWMVK